MKKKQSKFFLKYEVGIIIWKNNLKSRKQTSCLWQIMFMYSLKMHWESFIERKTEKKFWVDRYWTENKTVVIERLLKIF